MRVYDKDKMFLKILVNVFVVWFWFFTEAGGEGQVSFGELTQGYFKKIEKGKFMPCKCYFIAIYAILREILKSKLRENA